MSAPLNPLEYRLREAREDARKLADAMDMMAYQHIETAGHDVHKADDAALIAWGDGLTWAAYSLRRIFASIDSASGSASK